MLVFRNHPVFILGLQKSSCRLFHIPAVTIISFSIYGTNPSWRLKFWSSKVICLYTPFYCFRTSKIHIGIRIFGVFFAITVHFPFGKNANFLRKLELLYFFNVVLLKITLHKKFKDDILECLEISRDSPAYFGLVYQKRAISFWINTFMY